METKLREEKKKSKKKTNKKIRGINIIENINRTICCIAVFIIKSLIIINLRSRTKSNIFNIYYIKDSKISLKIKGVGNINILNDDNTYKFTSFNFLNKVIINGIEQEIIEYKYFFNQTENYIDLIWDDNINNCNLMFYNCKDITEINLSNFKTYHVTSMACLFFLCTSLTSLDLSNFYTSLVTNMYGMFSSCSNLTSLNLSSFNTSLVTNMHSIFGKCSSLTSLDLSNFDTSKVVDMYGMFANCWSLTSLDLSNFDTSLVENMYGMFYNCSSLTTLNLSNFNTSFVTKMERMFDSCTNLEYINLKNFDEIKLEEYLDMFKDIPSNVVICINEINTNQKILPQINQNDCHIIYCLNDWKSKQKMLINSSDECIISCDNNTIYKYEYNGKCYEKCSNEFLYDDNHNTFNKCKCELEKCLVCPPVALNKNLCTKCNDNYHPKENDPLNIGEYINCYKEPEGYYLNNDFYKKCYYTCKTCVKEGNNIIHNCMQCNEKFSFEIKINNHLNCYQNSSYIENNLEEIEYYDNILQLIEKTIISENYNTTDIENGEDKFIKSEKFLVTITTIKNQKNNINNNMTVVDLGECENLLRNFYNLSKNEALYMKKIDIIQEGMKTLKVEYDVYAKLLGKNLINLNISVCEKSKITISIPIILAKHIDIYNRSSGYYNDICYTTTSDDGTDILLKDRQKEYINKDRIICQENCDFSEYNYESFMAKCSCQVKECSESLVDMNINKAKIFENFKNIKNFINFNFLVCYNKLFNKEGILKNIGFYFIFAINLFHIVTIFIFGIKQFSILKNKIKNIASKKYKYQSVKENDKEVKKENPKKQGLKSKKISINIKNKKRNHIKKNISDKKYLNDNKIKIDLKNKTKEENINNYIYEEINGFSYILAIQYDKRTYFQYYISLIKTQHNLINALFNKVDYNSNIVKINLFLIGFTIEYTVNALFYNDETMHKIYESKGDFDLETQIPIAVYSTIISSILNYPLNILALSNDAIIDFKQDNSKILIMKRVKNLTNRLRIKFILYFIISFVFLLCFWYYLSMFCVIYKNTQIHLLKDTLISVGVSLILPFLIYLLPGIFRIPALSNKNKSRKCLYNFSKFLQSF